MQCQARHIWPGRRLCNRRLRGLTLASLPKLAVTRSLHQFTHVKGEDGLALVDTSQPPKDWIKCRVTLETSTRHHEEVCHLLMHNEKPPGSGLLLSNYKPPKNCSNGTTRPLMRSQYIRAITTFSLIFLPDSDRTQEVGLQKPKIMTDQHVKM